MMRLWLWPLVLGVLTMTGLIAGLVSDGYGDYWAWLGLGIPTGLALWYGLPVQRCRTTN